MCTSSLIFTLLLFASTSRSRVPMAMTISEEAIISLVTPFLHNIAKGVWTIFTENAFPPCCRKKRNRRSHGISCQECRPVSFFINAFPPMMRGFCFSSDQLLQARLRKRSSLLCSLSAVAMQLSSGSFFVDEGPVGISFSKKV